jgi:hypothetical protein
MGHPISADTVRTELAKLGFLRQFNRKADEGSKHPDLSATRNVERPPVDKLGVCLARMFAEPIHQVRQNRLRVRRSVMPFYVVDLQPQSAQLRQQVLDVIAD